ncbi:MAG: hypothetical protein KIH09_08120, partial [Candidatus Freyarchaeota archaeon]|nr:hypothetical protein [Candidatus Jordarchaeia archaeon]
PGTFFSTPTPPGMKIHKNRGLNALSPSKPPQKVNTKEYKNQNVIKGRLVGNLNGKSVSG